MSDDYCGDAIAAKKRALLLKDSAKIDAVS